MFAYLPMNDYNIGPYFLPTQFTFVFSIPYLLNLSIHMTIFLTPNVNSQMKAPTNQDHQNKIVT